MARLFVCLLLAAGLAACGTGGPTITDGSGNPVRIGGDPSASGGPGSPGWPMPSSSQGGR